MSELGRIVGQQVANWIAANQKAIERRSLLVGRLVVWAGRYKSSQVYAFNDMVMFRSYIALATEDGPRGLPQPGGAGWAVVANLATGGVDNFPDVVVESQLVLNTPAEVVVGAVSRWAMKQIQDSVARWPDLVRWRGWWSSNEVYQDRDLVLYNRSVWLNAGGDGPPNRNGWEWLLSTQSGNAGGVGDVPPPLAVLALHMLTPDTDGVMQGVLVGTGSLTATHTSDIYAQDEATGYYNSFGANKAVWAGGRFIDEDTVSAEDAGGTPYAQVPRLQDNPAATNLNPFGRQMGGWSYQGTPTVTQDATGIDGQSNKAFTIEDDDASDYDAIYLTVAVTADTEILGLVVWVGKEDDETHFPTVYLRVGTARAHYHLNKKTGALTAVEATAAGIETSVIDDSADFWKVCISFPNINDTFAHTYLYPASGITEGLVDASATGSTVFDCSMLTHGLSHAEIRAMPPIFTEGSAESIDSPAYSAPGSNHQQTNYGYSFYWTPTYNTAEVTDKRELLSLADGANLSYYDGDAGQVESTDGVNTVAGVQLVVPGTTYQISIAIGQAGANQLAIAVDDGPWQEGPYDGAFDEGTLLQLFRDHGYVGYMHDLQGWSGDYDLIKQKLDELRGAA